MTEIELGSIMQCGRKISCGEVDQIRETVALFPRLPLTESAATICEHLGWYTAAGTGKVNACLKLLRKLEAAVLLKLPEKQKLHGGRGICERIALTNRTVPGSQSVCSLKDLGAVKLEVVKEKEATELLVRSLMRKKKFQRYLIDCSYPIAIDGTQKTSSRVLWDEEWLERELGKGDKKEKQYYVYILEASLAFRDGMTIPLMSEFSDFNKGDTAQGKQDCEQIAFKRLAYRLKKVFPKYGFMLMIDGLYTVGPVVEQCRSNNWDFMIVLQDGSLPQVWEEYELLKKLLEKEDCLVMKWGDRIQHFHWINDIEYTYGPNGRKRQIVHVVVCELFIQLER